MRKNEKGFTLIELLAVIVILAVIALIATPTILGMIDRARESAAKSDMLAYVKEIERQVLAKSIDDPNGTVVSGDFVVDDNGQGITEDTTDTDKATVKLEIKGTRPSTDLKDGEKNVITLASGTSEVTSADLKFGNYYVHYQVTNGDAKTCTSKTEYGKTCS